jgi:hypothetical protein
MALTKEDIREAAEGDLLVFIRLLAPHLALADCHVELINWWQSSVRKQNCLALLPRGHLKSKLIAYKTAWELTRDPTSTILYASATSALAEKQLHMIKRILTSRTYTKYWPEMLHPDEGKRERWTADEIAVDHPKRAQEGIRDPSVKAVGLTSNFTGFHATNVKLDDIVVPKNAYTEDGRQKVANLVSQLASIKEPESVMDCVGTRYHPKDQYDTFQKQSYDVYDESMEIVGKEFLWDSYMRIVETDGVFLWPRKREDNGKSYGFDMNVLSKIKAEYEDRTQFFAQYYNNPNDPESMDICADKFQYYERRFLTNNNDRWSINGRPLNIVAAIDFAYSLAKKADWTSLVVVGIDYESNIYILDIVRFKSDRIADYFAAIDTTWRKWGYRKLRCEVTSAQKVIVRDLKENYLSPNGMMITVDEHTPTRHEGTKEERINATLQPRYDNRKMWHYKDGLIQSLEEELVLSKPPHDDIKDALTAAVDICSPPLFRKRDTHSERKVIYNTRWGGVN